MRCVVAVGPFPPPVHGMAKNLKLMADHLGEHLPVSRVSISPGSLHRGWKYHGSKALKVLLGILRVASLFGSGRSRVLYLPPDAGVGVYYSLIFVAIARIFRASIFLHHRSFAYISQKKIGMALLTRVAGRKCTHVFLCEKMYAGFKEIYQVDFKSLVVSNSAHVSPVSAVSSRVEGAPIRLGLMSNLSREKGVWDAIETLHAVRAKGGDATLILAGPFEDAETESYVLSQVSINPDAIFYQGRVDHDKKYDFYKQLDVFLFPTSYKNEAQPNVIFEAFAAGLPVIAYDRGCVASDLNQDLGLVVSQHDNFSDAAADKVLNWIKDGGSLDIAKRQVLDCIKIKTKEATGAYSMLISEIINAA